MTDIDQYLKTNWKEIVGSIQGKYIPSNITSDCTFDSLATQLQKKIELQHSNGTKSERDAAHDVLAMGIICSMWCGWLSQAKANDGRYKQEWVDSFKKWITAAFEIGREHSKETP